MEYYSNTDLVQHFGLTRNTQVDKHKFADHGGGRGGEFPINSKW